MAYNKRLFENGEATELAKEARLSVDSRNYSGELPESAKEILENKESTQIFQTKLRERVRQLGYQGDLTKTSHVLTFLLAQCKEAGIENLSRNTLKNWLESSPPGRTRDARKNVYKLCFALKMDHIQTEEFFLKAYMDRSFNYKIPEEAVYYFCLRTGKGYQDAQRLVETYQKNANLQHEGTEMMTERIGRKLSDIQTEEQLLDFLYEHHYEEEQQNYSAKKQIQMLLPRCYELARQEYEQYGGENAKDEYSYKMEKMESIDALLTQIKGYDEREMRKTSGDLEKARKKGLAAIAGSNFPERQQFYQIDHSKNVSSDVLFRILVLLEFYSFYADLLLKNPPESEFQAYADEFEDELCAVLADCGFIEAYERNPYIKLFLVCANSARPLDMFRDIIDEYFLSQGE